MNSAIPANHLYHDPINREQNTSVVCYYSKSHGFDSKAAAWMLRRYLKNTRSLTITGVFGNHPPQRRPQGFLVLIDLFYDLDTLVSLIDGSRYLLVVHSNLTREQQETVSRLRRIYPTDKVCFVLPKKAKQSTSHLMHHIVTKRTGPRILILHEKTKTLEYSDGRFDLRSIDQPSFTHLDAIDCDANSEMLYFAIQQRIRSLRDANKLIVSIDTIDAIEYISVGPHAVPVMVVNNMLSSTVIGHRLAQTHNGIGGTVCAAGKDGVFVRLISTDAAIDAGNLARAFGGRGDPSQCAFVMDTTLEELGLY